MPVKASNQKLREKCAEHGIVYTDDADAAAKLAARFGIADMTARPAAGNILLAVHLMEKHAGATYTRLEERRRMQQKNGR